MSEQYQELVAGLHTISGCPFAENGWTSRPNVTSYGVVTLEYEPDALYGDDLKQIRAFEGSVDLFSKRKDGEGFVQAVEYVLTEICEGCWRLNSFQWERNEGIFHWEWVYQVEE